MGSWRLGHGGCSELDLKAALWANPKERATVLLFHSVRGVWFYLHQFFSALSSTDSEQVILIKSMVSACIQASSSAAAWFIELWVAEQGLSAPYALYVCLAMDMPTHFISHSSEPWARIEKQSLCTGAISSPEIQQISTAFPSPPFLSNKN